MFLHYKKRYKDGKEHLYWSIVENCKVSGGWVLQRHVLYLGELNGRQEASVLEKLAAVQMLDVHLPSTDDREIVLTRYTQPEKDLLLEQLKITLPEQAPPIIYYHQLLQNRSPL